MSALGAQGRRARHGVNKLRSSIDPDETANFIFNFISDVWQLQQQQQQAMDVAECFTRQRRSDSVLDELSWTTASLQWAMIWWTKNQHNLVDGDDKRGKQHRVYPGRRHDAADVYLLPAGHLAVSFACAHNNLDIKKLFRWLSTLLLYFT